MRSLEALEAPGLRQKRVPLSEEDYSRAKRQNKLGLLTSLQWSVIVRWFRLPPEERQAHGLATIAGDLGMTRHEVSDAKKKAERNIARLLRGERLSLRGGGRIRAKRPDHELVRQLAQERQNGSTIKEISNNHGWPCSTGRRILIELGVHRKGQIVRHRAKPNE